MGTIDSTLNGVNGQAIKITLNSAATFSASQALLRAIGYANTSDDPSSGLSNKNRTVRITLDDGGNTSGIGPVVREDASLSVSADVTINYTSINNTCINYTSIL